MIRVITKIRQHAEDLLKKEKAEEAAKAAAKPAAPPPTPEDIQLLREIRDLLKKES